MIKEFFYHSEFMVLIKNKYAYFNIKNFIRFLKNEEKGKLYDQVNLEPLLPLLLTCLTKSKRQILTVGLRNNLIKNFGKNQTFL